MRQFVRYIKSIALVLVAVLLFDATCVAQCTNAFAFGTATAPTTTTPLTITTCVYQNEYNTINSVVAGNTYVSTNSAGGCITVHSGTPGGPVVGFGPSPLTWTATVSGTYYIHYNTNCACGTTTGCTTSTITCTSCGATAPNPCTSIINIAACGTAVTANLSGTGAGWNTTACGFTTSGAEQIYSFTPTVTGIYSLNVTSASGGYIDYFWVNSTSGCSSAAPWTCIDDISSVGTWGSMSWTAGQTYYILLDAEPTSATSQTFSINCVSVPNPCASILPLTCGTAVTANLSGSGAGWNTTACGFTTSGAEVIYSFTPSVTGTHSLNVTAASGGFIDYFWINSTSGCSSTAPWTCIDDISSTGSWGSMSWTAGQTYYILLNAEPTSATSQTFSIQCPGGSAVTASECIAAVNVCTNLTFSVDPSGYGATMEIPALGTVGNPSLFLGDGLLSTWGSDHDGCLRTFGTPENNSTWMIVNVATAGNLEFSFGAAGGFNCYDWIMYPYNTTACASIPTGSYAPVRCNWNNPCASFTGVATAIPAGGNANNFEPAIPVVVGQQFVICFSNYTGAITTVPLNFFGTASVSCTPLPVELTTFNGNKKDKDILLYWHTQTETNVSHYTIMHSVDGLNFSPVGNITSLAANNAASYDFTHTNPIYGINYYRLIMTDADNKSQESGILAIDFRKEEFVVGDIRPNPSAGVSHITVDSKDEAEMVIVISDISGKVVNEQKISLVKGSNTIEINTAVLAKGIYHFAVSGPRATQSRVQKLVVE
ncbi:MAG TPA: T9SS type A sorting domain-containing protein [Flavobacteriales bacterium]|nr:T9SS type A sorting domain-containing protein [Flavobacteriales bacterium]